MDKYKRFYGLIIFLIVAFGLAYGAYSVIAPKIQEISSTKTAITKSQNELEEKKKKRTIVSNKIKKIKDSIANSQKKIYSPLESSLGNDTLFFTLYNDVLEMIHANSIKIRSINYNYNPKEDEFVKFGKDVYFVCDMELDLVSNYVNLGKLIQDLYQYPYYIKINELKVEPYTKDKKILLSSLSLRLYAHTEPEQEFLAE